MTKVKVLFLGADPLSDPQNDAPGPRLRIDEEMREIVAKVRASEHRDSLDFTWQPAARADDLLQAFNEVRPEVVHFSGRGSTAGEIIVVGRDGKPHAITDRALHHLFRTMQDRIRLVLLNSSYSEAQCAGITESIDCVVGMDSEMSAEGSIAFAASFYRAIGFGHSVRDAFEQGRLALMLQRNPEDHVPRLSVRPGVDPGRVILVPSNSGQEPRQSIFVQGSGNTLYVAGGNMESQAAGPEKDPAAAHPDMLPGAHPAGPGELVLLQVNDTTRFCTAASVTERGDAVVMVLHPKPQDVAFLSMLTPSFGRPRLWAVFAESAVHGVAESVERSRAGGEERWTVTLAKESDRGDLLEMSVNGISADQIAELRARRILLDERPPSETSAWILADPTLEMVVRGTGRSGREDRGVERSPLPPLFSGWTGSRADFLAAARLAAVLALQASRTVEHVLELTLAWSGESAVSVRFHGQRRKVYSNRPAPEIRVEGVCQLAG